MRAVICGANGAMGKLIPVVFSGNMRLVIAVLFRLAKEAAKFMVGKPRGFYNMESMLG